MKLLAPVANSNAEREHMTLDPLNTVTKTKLLLFIPQPSKVNMFVSEFLQMYPESNSWCKNRKKLFNF